MALTTSEGLQVSPEQQFDIGPDGELAVNRDVATTWHTLHDTRIAQMGNDEWGVYMTLAAPQQHLDGRSRLDVLKDPEVSYPDKFAIQQAVHNKTHRMAAWLGMTVVDGSTYPIPDIETVSPFTPDTDLASLPHDFPDE